MEGAFWAFLSLLLREYGIVALVVVVQIGIIVYLFKLLAGKDDEKSKLQERLLELSEKRLEQAKEERADYEELARNLDKSINLLIKVFRSRRNGNGDEGD
jgi:uncharacterized membrane-anchored protein YhcB (DUF1043 family)